MERTSPKALREKVRNVRSNEEKRRSICVDFCFESELNYQDETRCSRCGKVFEPGERCFHFQGCAGDLCDICFCDEMEAMVYQERGLNFTSESGKAGGTIWVTIEGEEPIWNPY